MNQAGRQANAVLYSRLFCRGDATEMQEDGLAYR
jgi:hypothetical protein